MTRARPPGWFNFSSTWTRQPRAHKRTAAANPPKPLPITKARGAWESAFLKGWSVALAFIEINLLFWLFVSHWLSRRSAKHLYFDRNSENWPSLRSMNLPWRTSWLAQGGFGDQDQ
jgi:hypothetical protein